MDKINLNQTDRYNITSDTSVLKVRLESETVLERVRIFLTGEISTVVYDDKGKPFINVRMIAEKKCNDEGTQWILNYVENIINPSTVQGNFKFEQYETYIAECHDGLILNLMTNLTNWGINEDNYEAIIDTIMNLIQPFISRLIDNKERESYIATMQIRESNTIEQNNERGGLFSKFRGGN
jgi:hypothetical protein